ncbi:MAG: GTPase, partial [Pseudomonadota bacterium]
MKPVVALIGRPNVGKSTLFNCLTRKRTAIVIDLPGVTRDRQIGDGALGDRAYYVMDTGGVGTLPEGAPLELIEAAVRQT